MLEPQSSTSVWPLPSGFAVQICVLLVNASFRPSGDQLGCLPTDEMPVRPVPSGLTVESTLLPSSNAIFPLSPGNAAYPGVAPITNATRTTDATNAFFIPTP